MQPPITLVSSDLPVQIGLQQNRYDATMQTMEVVRYLQRQDPDTYVSIGQPLRNWLYGFAFPKGNVAIRDYVAAGLKRIIDDGTYARVLAKHSPADQAVTTVQIDAGQP